MSANSEQLSAHDSFAPDEIALRPRDVQFDFSKSPLHWMHGEPYASHVIAGFGLALPAGERLFCKVFTEALDLVGDERLREDMIGFIGQEAIHAKSHDKAVVDHLLRHGVDAMPFINQAVWLESRVDEMLERLKPGQRRAAIKKGVFAVAVAEHFTAVLGDWVLNCKWDESNVDPALADLFRWHGAEEVEHRHVAHNVAVHLGMGYGWNILGAIGGLGVIPALLYSAKYLVRQDPTLPNLGMFQLFREYRKAAKRGVAPTLGYVIRASFRLFNPRYTPESIGNTAQAVAYLAASPAARAIRAEALEQAS